MAVVGSVFGTGGTQIGGTATVAFVHGTGQVASDVVVEADWDNDGDFDQAEEAITDDVTSLETATGRDWPSQLTGKAGPGELRGRLRNDNNQYSVFNQQSPLNQAPNSLDPGRKLRVRTAEAADPDPVLLARDRFRRPDGPLTVTETGQTWEQPGPTFQVADQAATVTTTGAGHVAVIELGVTDYLIQVRLGRNLRGPNSNLQGIIYRYVDPDNLSILWINYNTVTDINTLEAVDIVAGTPTVAFGTFVNTYDGVSIGVAVDGSVATLLYEGAAVTTVTAINPSATKVGIYGQWVDHVPPSVDEFWVWDRATARTDGILWTGDIEDLKGKVAAGPNKTATLTGKGWLSKLATHRSRFPGAIDGSFTGRGIGKALSDSNLLSPPGLIDQGTLNTGPVGLDELDSIELARRFEETELGFLHEGQEGWLNFDERGARTGRSPVATFSDDPDAQFHYEGIELLDWRREIFNEVKAGVAPLVPFSLTAGPNGTTGLGTTAANIVVDVGGGTPPDAGWLMISHIVLSGFAVVEWRVPNGWTDLSGKAQKTNGGQGTGNWRIYAKIADGTETGTVQVADVTSGTVDYVTHTWFVVNNFDWPLGWFGDIAQGVVVSDEIQANEPPPIFPTWDPQPGMILATRVGANGTNTVIQDWTGQGFDGFFDSDEIPVQATNGAHCAIQSCYKSLAATPVIKPAPFDGVFNGFAQTAVRVIAIRGYAGDPPEPNGIRTVTVADTASQDRHNIVKSYTNPANLFRTEADATEYANLVLARHGRPRPVVQITFTANKSAAYRQQAARRRAGDMIRLEADNQAGQGIAGGFFIEHVRHSFTDGMTRWECTWQLSPA